MIHPIDWFCEHAESQTMTSKLRSQSTQRQVYSKLVLIRSWSFTDNSGWTDSRDSVDFKTYTFIKRIITRDYLKDFSQSLNGITRLDLEEKLGAQRGGQEGQLDQEAQGPFSQARGRGVEKQVEVEEEEELRYRVVPLVGTARSGCWQEARTLG